MAYLLDTDLTDIGSSLVRYRIDLSPQHVAAIFPASFRFNQTMLNHMFKIYTNTMLAQMN